MNQIERIEKMSEFLEQVESSQKEFEKALQNYANSQKLMAKLSRYYFDGAWRKDYEADEKGKFTKEISVIKEQDENLSKIKKQNGENLINSHELATIQNSENSHIKNSENSSKFSNQTGKFSHPLNLGALSQDGIYNAFCENKYLAKQMQKLSKKILKTK